MKLGRASLVLSVVLLLAGPVFANLSSLVLHQVGPNSLYGTVQVSITTNFEAYFTSSVASNGFLPGTYSCGIFDPTVSAPADEMTGWVSVSNIPAEYFVYYAGNSNMEIADWRVKVAPTWPGVPEGSTYDISSGDLEAHIWTDDNDWPVYSTDGPFVPQEMSSVPVLFSFPAAAEPVPLPGAALLGVLGVSVAGWRLRRFV